jgi:hypothetical protein
LPVLSSIVLGQNLSLIPGFPAFAAVLRLAMNRYGSETTTFDSALAFEERPEPVVRTAPPSQSVTPS